MAADDDPFDPRPRSQPPRHEIGQPLDNLSLNELAERVLLLREEIARLEGARDAKSAAAGAADAIFRRS